MVPNSRVYRGGVPGRVTRSQRFMCYPQHLRNINLFVRVPNWANRSRGSNSNVTPGLRPQSDPKAAQKVTRKWPIKSR